MAGLILLSESRDLAWSAPSWLFDWVVRRLSRSLANKSAARTLDEVVDENLGIVVLDQFDEDVRQELLQSVRNRLVPWAESELLLRPGADREGALNQLRDLANMANFR